MILNMTREQQIKELEQLANEKSNDYYHAGCLEEQQDLAEKALLIIKELQEQIKEQEGLLDHGLTAAHMNGLAQGNDKIRELQETLETATAFDNSKAKQIKRLEEENKKLKELIKVEATKIYNITKDNKYNYHACELDGDDEEEIFKSSKLILNIIENENN